MRNIKTLIDDRNAMITQFNQDIFNVLDSAIVVINDFLVEVGEVNQDDKIVWKDLELLDELVTMHGIVEYKIGTEVVADGIAVEITHENVKDLHGVVFMTLDLDVLDAASDAELKTYLDALANKQDLDFSDGSAALSSEVQTPDVSIQDFDLDALSEEQIKSLRLYERGNLN